MPFFEVFLMLGFMYIGWKGLGRGEMDPRTQVLATVIAAFFWGLALWAVDGFHATAQFLSGYVMEWVLSIDNLVAFWVVFKYFDLGSVNEARVLKIGLFSAAIGRLIAAVAGAAAIKAYFPILQVFFALAIAYTGYKVLMDTGASGGPDVQRMRDRIERSLSRFGLPYYAKPIGHFFYQGPNGVKMITPMLLCLLVIEFTDILFSVDSIPAVIAVAKHPLAIFSATMFAIMGLRGAYPLVSQGILKYDTATPVSVILFFVAGKLILEAVTGWTVSPLLTALVIFGIIGLWVYKKGINHAEEETAKGYYNTKAGAGESGSPSDRK